MKKYILIILVLMGWVAMVEAQSIKRSVLCSVGGSMKTATRRVAFTAGECPGCGTLEGATGFVRQGFQQPPALLQDTTQQPLPDCAGIVAEFEIDSVEQGVCGTYYNFTYTGTPDPNLQFQWNFGANAFPSTSTEQNPQNIAYASTGEKTIVLIVLTDTCQENTAKSIEVFNDAFGIDASLSAGGGTGGDPCAQGGGTNGQGSIDVSAGGGQAPITYSWNTGVSTQDLLNVAYGTYTVTATDANGCTASLSLVLDGNSGTGGNGGVTIDSADIKGECKNDASGFIHLSVSGGQSPYSFDWNNDGNSINIDNLNQGTYTVIVMDANGCKDTASYTVSDFCDDPGGENGTIPNVFSPNGDGINDFFVIDGLDDYPNNEIFIYNRWGDLVYSKKNYDNTWAGTHNDKPLPSAAYYYVVNLNDADNNAFTGSITIIR